MKNPQSVYRTSASRDRNVESVRSIIESRDRYGPKKTVLKTLYSVNEQGIQRAGEQSLPYYGTLALAGIVAAFIAGAFLPSILGSLLGLVANLAFVGLTIATPAIIYWDCRAADRYLNANWIGGKFMAVISVFLTAFVLPFYLYYRAKKMS